MLLFDFSNRERSQVFIGVQLPPISRSFNCHSTFSNLWTKYVFAFYHTSSTAIAVPLLPLEKAFGISAYKVATKSHTTTFFPKEKYITRAKRVYRMALAIYRARQGISLASNVSNYICCSVSRTKSKKIQSFFVISSRKWKSERKSKVWF